MIKNDNLIFIGYVQFLPLKKSVYATILMSYGFNFMGRHEVRV